MDSQTLMSVIVPIYNAESTLGNTVGCLLRQSLDKNQFEVILVDDGSTDQSGALCDEYAQNYPGFIQVIHQENGGVCKARNNGILHATGRYILLLDADDTINDRAIEFLTEFFSEHDDEIDIVGLRLKYVYANGKTKQHRRYTDSLRGTGVYDLSEKKSRYIAQTTINICFRNSSELPIQFEESMIVGEDQLFVSRILARRGKIGYMRGAVYLYDRSNPSASSTMNNPLYCYDNMLRLFDELQMLGQQHPELKNYYDAIILYNFNFRIRQDILFPYYMDDTSFNNAVERIKGYISGIDDDLILSHPDIDIFHRFTLLSWKQNAKFKVLAGDNKLVLCDNDRVIHYATTIEAVIYKFSPTDTTTTVYGYLKSPLLLFMNKPTLYAETKTTLGECTKLNLDLFPSTWDCYKSKMPTNRFWNFSFTVSAERDEWTKLFVEYAGSTISVSTFFMQTVPFGKADDIQRFYLRRNVKYNFSRDTLTVSLLSDEQLKYWKQKKSRYYRKNKATRRAWLVREYSDYTREKDGRVWLYYDCRGVHKDNGYYQFVHDFGKNDGIKRYFIFNGSLQEYYPYFTKEQQSHLVQFGSNKHKRLYLHAEMIITAYIEYDNIVPYTKTAYGRLKDILSHRIVYLQHGILHATTPWKYAFDRLDVNNIVVSTQFEVENFSGKYGYPQDCLIPCGMPRYDYIDNTASPVNKILYAPSWRNYLLNGKEPKGGWIANESRFLKSAYFQGVDSFLSSPKLHEALKQHGYTLDFKLHPIFACYSGLFSSNDDCISIVDEINDPSEYKIFITDFSSMYFDYVYLNRALLFFIPDYREFKAGLATYRDLDTPLENGFGPFTITAETAIEELGHIMSRNGYSDDSYRSRADGQFLYYDNNQCERIYASLINLGNNDNRS